MMGFAVSTVAVIMAAWFGYVAGRAGRPRVPAGTSSPEAQAAERQRLANVRRTIRDDPGHSVMCDCGECLRVFGG